jgi:hypothetical protein
MDYVTLILPAVVPLLIALTKWAVPRIPRAAIPVLAPILGAGLEVLGYYAGVTSGNPVAGAVMGALGVWLREVVDQLKQATAAPPA